MKEREILVSGTKVRCRIVRRKGMKRMMLSIRSDGSVLVSAPRFAPFFFIYSFLERSVEWVEREYAKHSLYVRKKEEKKTRYEEKREEAREIITQKVEMLAKKMGIQYGKISIRNQSTRWGSCSRKGDLSFCYEIAYFPENILNYVVIHELCHRLHFDHSKRFWSSVEQFCPEYRETRDALHELKKF